MLKDKKESIVADYAELSKTLKRSPKMDELVAKGHTKDSIKHHFSSLTKLDEEARIKSPDSFFDIGIEDIFGNKAIKELRSKIRAHKRFFITTAVTGCAIDDNFYASIRGFCKQQKALLLLLVASDPAHVQSKNGFGSIDRKLANESVVFEDTDLNDNLFISTIKLSAKHIDPTTGLDRIGQRAGSFIFASPKQRLNMVATSNLKLPHALMTTGAITTSNYHTDLYLSERTAYIADADHVMGGLIVEIQDDQVYHYRQVQARPDGSFVDIGTVYKPNGKSAVEAPEAIVLGDWHAGSTDISVRACTMDMFLKLKPKKVILHDAFDGASVNHHDDINKLNKAVRFMRGAPSLEEEIVNLAHDLEWILSEVKDIAIVKSNHDEFLCKHYLQKAKYADDPQNHYYSLTLAQKMMEGHDPLAYAVSSLLDPSSISHIRWLARDEDLTISGVQLGAHGDKGPNGSRGSLRNIEKAYGNSVTGHSHTPGILRGAWAVGTSSHLKLSYNEGPSSWLQTHCLVYKDGSRQLINMVNGRWKL
jgi:hypothetical protein